MEESGVVGLLFLQTKKRQKHFKTSVTTNNSMTREVNHGLGNISGVTEGMSITWKKERTGKLPGIGKHHRSQVFEVRCEREIFNKLHKVDKQTLNNVY